MHVRFNFQVVWAEHFVETIDRHRRKTFWNRKTFCRDYREATADEDAFFTISRGHCGATADEGLLCSTWKGNCSMFNVHVRNTLFNFFQLQYTGTDDLKRRAIVEATADEDPGKRSVPGTGSVSTCTFAFFQLHLLFLFQKFNSYFFAYKSPAAYISSRSAAYKTYFAVFIKKHF